MTSENLILYLGVLSIRSIGSADQDLLRFWRNLNRDAFLYRETINARDQDQWFSEYLQSNDNFLFMVENVQNPFGCLGLRWKNDRWDVYNVIRGISNDETRGGMGIALRAAISFVLTRQLAPVQAIVLASNPALNWYVRQGFQMVSEVKVQNESCLILNWLDPSIKGAS